MPLFVPTTAYNPQDPVGTTKAILIEYLDWVLDLISDTESPVVREGYPNFDGLLPLMRPHVAVYPMPGGGSRSPGFDDIITPQVTVGSTTYVERCVYERLVFNVDVYTSSGKRDDPAASGGIPVRDRLYGILLNVFGRQEYPLIQEIEVVEVRAGNLSQPLSDTDRDVNLGRLTVEVEVPSFYRLS